MQISGMETNVGKKPTMLTMGCFEQFNNIFRKTVEYLEKNEVLEFKVNFWDYEHELLQHGYHTLSKIYTWLAYYQILQIDKRKEPDPEREGKNRTMWSVRLGPFARQAYDKSMILTVDLTWDKDVRIGIGKDYCHFEELWKRVEAQASGVVAKTRWQRWFGEFRDFWIEKMAATKTGEAIKMVDTWARKKVADAPKLKSSRTPALLEGQVKLGRFSK